MTTRPPRRWVIQPRRLACLAACATALVCPPAFAAHHGAAATQPTTIGERVPSEDPLIKNLHSLGLIDGRVDIFRSACPVRDLARNMSSAQPTPEEIAQAKVRMQRLYDLGIRTIISFQRPAGTAMGAEKDDSEQARSVALEQAAAQQVGLRFVCHPMANNGPHSLEEMTDQQVIAWLDPIAREVLADAKTGGVDFHCSAGHDRAGILAAYLRIKYEHWSADEAIAEMRRLGHNWVKYSHNGGASSWHEDHLRAIAALLAQAAPSRAGASANPAGIATH